ncbi:MAG: hypothetical protein F6K55_04440 [Moorea sp. SIO4A3]|nr:hypothetical protein [Moorena sp. SIO4A3]
MGITCGISVRINKSDRITNTKAYASTKAIASPIQKRSHHQYKIFQVG